MNIVMYTGFAKKKNSTKVPPAGTTSITLTGTLKEPCSVMQPVFQIKRGAIDAVPDPYTYAYIAVFGRYYFVTDVTWIEGLWEISLEVDVLASYRTQIGNSSHYVLRTDSSTTNYDPMITDTMYPATNDFTLDQFALQSVFTSDPASGCYIVGIVSGNTNSYAVGAVTYYAMTPAQFGSLKGALLSDDNLITMDLAQADPLNPGTLEPLISDMSLALVKCMYNPFQYIASCMWFPFNTSAITSKSLVGSINIGWWSYNLSGYMITAQTIEFGEGPGTLPTHPQAATRGTFLNYAPYTRCTLFGRFGVIPLDRSFFGPSSDKLSVSYFVDLITGQCRARIQTYNSSASPIHYYLIAEQHFLLGVPIQLAQIATDYLGAAVTAVDAAANTMQNAITLNMAGAVSSAAHGVYDTLNAAMPQMATSGTNGSFIAPGTLTTVVTQFYEIVDEDISHKGRPLCQVKTINTLTGYILCADGEFDISCLNEERFIISNFLTTGFFWE